MTSVLITGGTGTFGSAAMAALLSRDDISRVVIFSRDEQKQEALRRTVRPDDRLRFLIGDVRDEARLRLAMHRIDVVIHAAAMKIVPTCEYDPMECVKTNVVGAMNVISAALHASSVQKVMAISTDKAVSAANLYGGAKFVAEKLFVSANHLAGGDYPTFAVARYGNVSGSRGSVIPYWRRLAQAGKAAPITHPDMTRFWITVEDAVAFVLQALAIQQGGEIFIPKMPSYVVADLAEAIWGSPDFERKIIGVRPGEKIHEDMITVHEAVNATQNDRAYVICPPWMHPGEPLPDGFSLSSANNVNRLSVGQIKELLANVR